ncbi:unnamed protein product [Closterium sp. NIES-54]
MRMEESHRVAVVVVVMLVIATASSLATTAVAQNLDPSQAAVLAECQQQWAIRMTGWDKGWSAVQCMALSATPTA